MIINHQVRAIFVDNYGPEYDIYQASAASRSFGYELFIIESKVQMRKIIEKRTKEFINKDR